MHISFSENIGNDFHAVEARWCGGGAASVCEQRLHILKTGEDYAEDKYHIASYSEGCWSTEWKDEKLYVNVCGFDLRKLKSSKVEIETAKYCEPSELKNIYSQAAKNGQTRQRARNQIWTACQAMIKTK